VLNNHTVPSVQGRDGGPNRRSPERLDIYRTHMEGLQNLVRPIEEQGLGLVFVTGDLNVNYRRDSVLAPEMFPYHRMGEVGLEASYQALGQPAIGTHVLRSGNDSRLIDYVYFQPGSRLQAYDQRVLTGFASDHRPLLVEFQVTRRA
jgi:endonuclease/exonuclease/phosphatase (EEP) superfamily protein YafD